MQSVRTKKSNNYPVFPAQHQDKLLHDRGKEVDEKVIEIKFILSIFTNLISMNQVHDKKWNYSAGT